MSSVVQRWYAPQIQPAYAGMVADQTNWNAITRICETAAGIPFGRAVSQGTGDKGCVIGGTKFIGISKRDITLVPGVPIDPLSDTLTVVDTYGRYQNVGIHDLGHIWVEAGANVAAGDALFYDTTTGMFTNSASGQAARGSITFSAQPAVDSTVTINGKAVTFKASGATGLQCNLGLTLGQTLENLVTVLNASNDTDIDDCTYAVFPESPGGAGQGSGAYMLLIGCDTVGEAGNSIALATNVTGATLSGETLAGGTASATAITGGYWVTSALAGELATVSLGIQR